MNFKFSNRNIPVCENNNPTIVTKPNPNITTSGKFYCRDPFIFIKEQIIKELFVR